MNVATKRSLAELLPALQAEVLTGTPEATVTGCYISDLLSDVLAHTDSGTLWVTIQIHRNVLSVAAMKDIAAVLLTCGRRPEPAVLREAAEAGIVLLITPLSSYEAAGKLWEAGLR